MPAERRGIARLAASAAATAGLTLAAVTWSESWFWGRWRDDDSVVGFLTTLLFYGAAVQVVRLVAARGRVAGVWRMLLLGALYGWLIEGVLVTTVIDDLPFTLAWTGLAWHALLTVLLGWWWVPRRLDGPVGRGLAALAALGIGVGAWAAFWRFELGTQPSVLEYALFAVLTTAAYAAGLAVWWSFRDLAVPGIRGSAAAIGALVVFAGWHGIQNPLTLVGVALVGVALLALVVTTPREASVVVEPRPPLHALARLVVIPIAATAVYAALGVIPDPLPTGWLLVAVTVPLSLVLVVVATVVGVRRRR